MILKLINLRIQLHQNKLYAHANKINTIIQTSKLKPTYALDHKEIIKLLSDNLSAAMLWHFSKLQKDLNVNLKDLELQLKSILKDIIKRISIIKFPTIFKYTVDPSKYKANDPKLAEFFVDTGDKILGPSHEYKIYDLWKKEASKDIKELQSLIKNEIQTKILPLLSKQNIEKHTSSPINESIVKKHLGHILGLPQQALSIKFLESKLKLNLQIILLGEPKIKFSKEIYQYLRKMAKVNIEPNMERTLHKMNKLLHLI